MVNGLANMLPDSYSGDDIFARYRQWLGIHKNRFTNAAEQVATIKYVLSGTALQWFNDIPGANMPATVNNLQRDLFAKFRIGNTRVEWKKELEKCKYIPGTSTLPMINKFQLYCEKLQWPLPVQIEKFVHILPMQLCQFVVSRAHATFAEVTESVKTFQELIEVDTVSHVLKNITFSDIGCTLCNESHKSLDCPSLRSIIEMEVSSSASPNDSSSSSDLCSRSPTLDFSSRRCRYTHGSRSTSRSARFFDRGHSPEIDYSHGRDYCYHSPDRNNNYRDRQYNPSYYDRRYIIIEMVSHQLGHIVRIITQIKSTSKQAISRSLPRWQ